MIYERGCVTGDWPDSAILCYTLVRLLSTRRELRSRSRGRQGKVGLFVYTLYADTLATKETMQIEDRR